MELQGVVKQLRENTKTNALIRFVFMISLYMEASETKWVNPNDI